MMETPTSERLCRITAAYDSRQTEKSVTHNYRPACVRGVRERTQIMIDWGWSGLLRSKSRKSRLSHQRDDGFASLGSCEEPHSVFWVGRNNPPPLSASQSPPNDKTAA